MFMSLRHTDNSIQIGLGVLMCEHESTYEHFEDYMSSDINVLDNISLFCS